MLLIKSLLRRVSAHSRSGRSRRRRPLSPCGFQAALVETLENRTLLSAASPFAVAANASQLVADIKAANAAGGAYTIMLAPNTTFDLTAIDNTTNGANGLPVIGGGKSVGKQGPILVNLTIVGNGDTIGRSSMAGTLDFRLFDVASGNSLTLENMTLYNGVARGTGDAADGGAIYSQGTLVLSGVTVQGNTALGADSQLVKKAPSPAPRYDAAGGGIWSSGSLALENNVVFLRNTAEGDDGLWASSWFGAVGNAYGGALYVAGGTVNSNGSVFIYNTAVMEGAVNLTNPSTAYGGAIYVAAGNVSLSKDAVNTNTAWVTTDNGDNIPLGGGLYVAAGTVTMSTVTVNSNSSGPGGGLFIAAGATVYLDAFTVANVSNNTFGNIDGMYILL
jgi:hypothetical protein